MKRFLGFTLSELLVALGVIGLIAAFSIPKILVDTSQNQVRLQIREALNAIEGLAVQGFAEERITANDPASLATYVITNIKNVKRKCPTGIDTLETSCMPTLPDIESSLLWSESRGASVLLNNNRTMISIGRSLTGTDMVYIYVYDLSTGIQRDARFPLIVGEGNAAGGQGSLLRRDTVNNADTTWIYS